jgi:hypothetical protein
MRYHLFLSLRSNPLNILHFPQSTLLLIQRARHASRPRAINKRQNMRLTIILTAKIQTFNSCAYEKY